MRFLGNGGEGGMGTGQSRRFVESLRPWEAPRHQGC